MLRMCKSGMSACPASNVIIYYVTKQTKGKKKKPVIDVNTTFTIISLSSKFRLPPLLSSSQRPYIWHRASSRSLWTSSPTTPGRELHNTVSSLVKTKAKLPYGMSHLKGMWEEKWSGGLSRCREKTREGKRRANRLDDKSLRYPEQPMSIIRGYHPKLVIQHNI